jgi:Protein of unknown function (DUF4232)
MASVIRPIRAGRPVLGAGTLLAAVALVAACGAGTKAPAPAGPTGSSAPPMSASPTAPASPSASASAAATGGGASAPCAASALKATVLRLPGSATAGTEHFPIDFTNTSGASCVLFGYPGVSFVTSPGGSQIGPAAARYDVNAPVTVSLAPGATAYATLSMADPGVFSASVCHPVAAHWLRIYPPNQTAPLSVSFTATVCSALPAKLGPQLAIAVVQPGTGKSHPEA